MPYRGYDEFALNQDDDPEEDGDGEPLVPPDYEDLGDAGEPGEEKEEDAYE
ncbi:MAG: hypothetical protein HYW89_02650 [Candidatus Sungiibacteriota bacterium]|uniref:Uncharacterized protein n=1 Tax=Candidatus Sungiibacteriota bacterium TaxID=2750080 RepID=A0A7T5RIS7_9BACT|nr:MAG: hypothetical protein HYW89_02650 [Candidatus Sungbacteria bacterium]